MIGPEKRLALCDTHKSTGLHASACIWCLVIKYHYILSQIDYAVAGNNDPDYPMAPFDVDDEEDAVLERVKKFAKERGNIVQDLRVLVQSTTVK